MATRYQLKTDRSGSVTSIKTTDTRTGSSTTYQGSNIKRSRRSGSSSSSSSSPKKYVDRFGVVRVEGQTGYKEADYVKAQSSGEVGSSGLPKVTASSGSATVKTNTLSAPTRSSDSGQMSRISDEQLSQLQNRSNIREDQLKDYQKNINFGAPTSSRFSTNVQDLETKREVPKEKESFVTRRARKVIEREERLEDFEREYKETPIGKASEFLSIRDESSVLGTVVKAPLQIPKAIFLDAPIILQRIPQAVDKAVLQVQARTFGSAEQKQESKFFQRGEQADALFKSISPLAPTGRDDQGRLRVQKGDKDAQGRKILLQFDKDTLEQIPVKDDVNLGFNPIGVSNVVTAGISAGLTAAPKLTRSSSPLKNVRGDVKVKVTGTKNTGQTPPTQTTTTLTYNQQSPTASGFFGRGAKTQIKMDSSGSVTRTTTVGSKTFVQTQGPGAKTSTLTVLKNGKTVSTRVEPALKLNQVSPKITSTAEGLSVTGTQGPIVTNIQGGTTFFRVDQPLSGFRRLQGDIKVTGLEKTTTNVNIPKTTTSTSITGGGTLKVTTPFNRVSSTSGASIPGLSITQPASQIDIMGTDVAGRLGDFSRSIPKSRFGSSTKGGSVSVPKPITAIPFAPQVGTPTAAIGGFSGLRPEINSNYRGQGNTRVPVTTNFGFLDRFRAKPEEQNLSPTRPVEDVITESPIEPVIDVPPIAEAISGSSGGSNKTVVNNIEMFSVPSAGPGVPLPVFGGLPFVPRLPSGGVSTYKAAKKRRRSKKAPTRSVFQSLFGVEGGVSQEGGSEQTGLFLRR